MDYKLAFKVLRIDVTQNQKEIIAAYRKLLPGCNPEDNADEFMKLREAFEVATEYAKNADYEEKMESDEAGEFLNSVENLYSDYARRINEEEWRSVLYCPFCVSLETSDIAREKLLVYLMQNYRMPHKVWKCIDDCFGIIEEQKKLCEIFPGEFIDYVVNQIQTDDKFPYEEMEISDVHNTHIDEYLTVLFRLEGITNDIEWGFDYDSVELKNDIEKLNEYDIHHPYQDVVTLNALLLEKQYEQASHIVETLSKQDFKDDCICYAIGKYYWETENHSLACEYFMEAVTINPKHYTARLYLAKNEFNNKRYYECREIAEELLSINNNNAMAEQLLDAANEEYVKILSYEYENGIEDEHFKKGMLPIELGWCLFQLDETEKCIEILSSLEPEEDEKYAYHNLYGRVLCSMERFEEGLEHLIEWNKLLDSIKEDGTEETAKRISRKCMAACMLGNCYYNLGKVDAAIDNYEKGIVFAQNQNEKIGAIYQLANMLFEIGEFHKCLEKCDELLELNRRYYAGYILRQKAFFELRIAQGVVDDYYNATSIYDAHFAPYYCAALMFYELGRDEDCKAVLDRALENEVEFPPKMKLLNIKLKRVLAENETNETAYKKLLKELDELENMRDDEGFDIEDISDINFERGLVYWNLCALDNSKKNQSMVKQYLLLTINENPKALRGYTAYCDFIMHPSRRDNGNKYLDEAENYYNRALENVGREIPVIYGLGIVCYLRDQQQQGIQYFEEVLERTNTYRSACTIVKDYYLELYTREYNPEYFDKAVAAISREIDRNPDCDFYIDRGLVYLRAYKMNLAIADFESAISCNPDHWSSYNNLECCYKYLGEYEKAIEYGQKALECLRDAGLKATNPYRNMADCYSSMGQYEKAIECYLKAIEEMDYDEKAAYDNIVDLYMSLGDYENAKLAAQKAKSEYDYQQVLVEIELRKGNVEKAFQIAKDSLRLCEDTKSYAKGLHDLAEWYGNMFDSMEKAIEYNIKSLEVAEGCLSYQYERDVYSRIVMDSLYIGKEVDNKYKKKIEEYIKDFETNLEDTLNFLRLRPSKLARYAMLQICVGNYDFAKKILTKIDGCKKCYFCTYKGCWEQSMYMGDIYLIQKDYANAKRMYEEAMERSGDYASLGGLIKYLDRMLNL